MYQLAIKQYLGRHGFETLRPKAVLFDMDGVLYDSMPNHAIAWQQSMAQFDIHMTADDAYATEGARGVETIRKMVLQQQGREIDEAEAQRMYDVKSRIFHDLPEAPVMKGMPELMQKITADGLQCCVVTGSGQRPLIQRILKDFGAFVDEQHTYVVGTLCLEGTRRTVRKITELLRNETDTDYTALLNEANAQFQKLCSL